jgi:hypothetical protein
MISCRKYYEHLLELLETFIYMACISHLRENFQLEN